MKVLITGDSHVGIYMQARQKGLVEPIEKATGIEFEIKGIGPATQFASQFFTEYDGYAEMIVRRYRKNFVFMPPKDRVYDAIGFSGPLHTTRLIRQDWSAHAPWSVAGSNRHAVSVAMLTTVIDEDVKYQLRLLEIMRARTKVFVIEAPAPFRHHKANAANGEDTILYIDRLYREYVYNKLAALDIPVVRLAPEWIDGGGFMDPQFRNSRENDQHHGNVQFGCAMLERVAGFLVGDPSGKTGSRGVSADDV